MNMVANRAKIVVLGSSAMDITFGVGKYPIPGEEVQANIRLRPGGKGFFSAIGCSRLEARTTLISSVAPDMFGERIKQHLQGERVILHVDESEAQQQTDLVAVFQSENSKTAYIASRDQERLSLRFLERPEIADAIKDCHVILLSFDLALDRIQKIVELARAYRKPLVINASPPADVPLSILRGANRGADRGDVDFVVATKAEGQAWLRRFPQYEKEADKMSAEKVAATIQDHDAKQVVITVDRDKEGEGQDKDACVVVDRRQVRTYETYEEAFKLTSNGARSAFCSALTVSYAAWLASSPATGTMPPIDDFIDFAAASRHFAYQVMGGGQPSLADVQAFLTNGRRGATLVASRPRYNGDIDANS